MFASPSHLDLNVIVGPEKPSDIKTILSDRLPILIDYSDLYRLGYITDSTLGRMRAALGHRDRVREIYISFEGSDVFQKLHRGDDQLSLSRTGEPCPFLSTWPRT
jgi:hypothetical protein